MAETALIFLALGWIALSATSILQTRRIVQLRKTLDRVRMATYELTTSAADDIADLQDTIKGMRIPMVTTRRDERLRRMALTPEERLRESEERFEQVVAEAEKQWRNGG